MGVSVSKWRKGLIYPMRYVVPIKESKINKESLIHPFNEKDDDGSSSLPPPTPLGIKYLASITLSKIYKAHTNPGINKYMCGCFLSSLYFFFLKERKNALAQNINNNPSQQHPTIFSQKTNNPQPTMPTPEVWGPAVWTLYHSLVEFTPPQLVNQVWYWIVLLTKHLPCPTCAADASTFLSKVRPCYVTTQENIRKVVYLLHNYVNKKKNKPLFLYSDVSPTYQRANFPNVLTNFFQKYHTHGNLQQLTESLHRDRVSSEYKKWIQQVFVPSVTSFSSSVASVASSSSEDEPTPP